MLTHLALSLALLPQLDPHQPGVAPPTPDRGALTRATGAGLIPRGVSSFGAAWFHGQIYAIGGYFGRPHEYSVEHQSGDFFRLDPQSGQIQLLPSLGPIQGAPLVEVDDGLVQVGGMRIRNTEDEPQNLQSVDEVRFFDPIGEAWSDLPALPAPRSSHDAIAVGNTVWVVGGWRLDDQADSVWLNTMLSLDLDAAEPRWREHPQPFQTRALALGTDGTHLIAVGGIGPHGTTEACWMFDLEAGLWLRGPDYPGFAFGAAAVGTEGGFLASGRDGVVRRWRKDGSDWEAEGQLWFPRFFHRLVVEPGGDVFAIGGIHEGGRPTLVERLRPGSPGPAMVELSATSPMPARSRQAVATVRSDLLLVGGNNGVDQHDFEPERFESTSWRFDPSELRWERLADAPQPRQSSKLVELRSGTLALIGGFAHDGQAARAHDQVWTYNGPTDSWDASHSPLPFALTQFGIARVEDRFFIAGGMAFDPDREDSFGVSDAILVAAVDGDELRFEVSDHVLPELRRAHAFASHGADLFVFGGMGDGFAGIEPSRALDTGTGEWREVSSPPLGVRFGASLIPIDGKLLLVGGTLAGGAGRARAVEVYDPEADRWSILEAEIPFAQSRILATTYQGQLLVASAQETEGRLRFVLIDPHRSRSLETAAAEASAPIESN